MESVYELPDTFDWSPQAVLDYIEERYPEASESCSDEIGVLFELADGLYWFCVDYHGGQWSDLYRISCQLGYKPGSSESSPTSTDEERHGAFYVYSMLEAECGFNQDTD